MFFFHPTLLCLYNLINNLIVKSSASLREVQNTIDIPLASILVDFYDNIKSISSGYASLNYDFADYRKCEVVKMDILVAEDPVEALTSLVYKDEVHKVGKRIINKLKEVLPRQQFVIKLQAAVGGKIVAGEKLSALGRPTDP